MAATTKFAKAQLDLREPVPEKKSFSPGSSIKVLKFTFNPKDYSISLKTGWTFKPQKKSAELPEFTGNQPRTFDFEMFLDATDQVEGDVSGAIDTLMSTMRPTAKSTSSGTPFPPIVLFSWGVVTPFVGVVSSVNASVTLFRTTGQPLRASCKVSMQEYAAEPEGQNPTSGAIRSNQAHTVVLGDTLASIAHTSYGSPTLWRAIAAANDIDDPATLRVGSELLIPAPADAMTLA